MSHEISQLDISDRQLLASNARPSVWTEIGEATITHTIFGRAKVRIIRKHDNFRRALWLTAMVAAAIVAAAWLGLFTLRQTESQQSEDLAPSVSAKEQVSVPALQSENIASPAAPPAALKEPGTPAQTGIDKPEIVQKSAPQPVQGSKSPEQKVEKPVTPQPKPVMVQQKPVTAQPNPVTPQSLAASKPQTAPLATNASRNPTDNPLPPRLASSKPAPAVAAPAVTKPVAQPAASSPAAMPQLSDPLLKDAAPAPSSPGVNQPPAPANVQSK